MTLPSFAHVLSMSDEIGMFEHADHAEQDEYRRPMQHPDRVADPRTGNRQTGLEDRPGNHDDEERPSEPQVPGHAGTALVV